MLYIITKHKGTSGEIDYLAVIDGRIIPIEVKAGTQGKMQSLYNFMPKHSSAFGIRTSLENISSYIHKDCHVKTVPLYALSSLSKFQSFNCPLSEEVASLIYRNLLTTCNSLM